MDDDNIVLFSPRPLELNLDMTSFSFAENFEI